MNARYMGCLVVLGLVLAAGVELRGQAKIPAAEKIDVRGEAIADALDGDPSRQQEAAAAFAAWLHEDARGASKWFRTIGASLFTNAGRHRDLLELTLQVQVARASELATVELCQRVRTRSLLAMNRPGEAAAAAKSFYSVCGLAATPEAIELLVEALPGAFPGDKGIAAKFKLEQLSGSSPHAVRKPSVLDRVKVDESLYAKALQDLADPVSYGECLARGNLLLLSDRPNDAMAAFKMAYAGATPKQLAEVTESMARAMRAQYASVGNANEWLTRLADSAGKQLAPGELVPPSVAVTQPATAPR